MGIVTTAARGAGVERALRRIHEERVWRTQRVAELKELLDAYSTLISAWSPAHGTALEWSLAYLRDLAQAELEAHLKDLEPPLPPKGGSGQATALPLPNPNITTRAKIL